MWQLITNSAKSFWRTVKITYHTAAFASLVVVILLVANHRVTGYTQADFTFGNSDTATQAYQNGEKSAENAATHATGKKLAMSQIKQPPNPQGK